MNDKIANKVSDNALVWRYRFVLMVMLSALVALAVRTFQIQIADNEFLLQQGDARAVRTFDIQSHRGIIRDRNGEELAVSIPVQSIWFDPVAFQNNKDYMAILQSKVWRHLAQTLGMTLAELNQKFEQNRQRRFVYLKRQVQPAIAQYVKALGVPGVQFDTEAQRYYPAAEVTAHLIGFTGIDDHGQEGIERAYDSWLSAENGQRRIVKDRRGNIVEQGEIIKPKEAGKDLALSIDSRIQFLAYKELKKAVIKHAAASGSVVVMDIKTGEVLAMVNQPSYNPNLVSDRKPHRTRNRAMSDTFEPGSTVKPLIMVSALESGQYQLDSVVDTSPGRYRIGGRTVRDSHNYGKLDLTHIIQKSSNVGISRIALTLDKEQLLSAFYQMGFGMDTGSSFPGEASGNLRVQGRWSDFEIATLSFGYGMTVTPLQLTQAYAAIANDGLKMPVSLLRVDESLSQGEPIMSPSTASSVVSMMESVVATGGTGTNAQVEGYRVAGKTGTARKAVAGGYGDDYIAVFSGLAPVSSPRLAIVVMVNEPQGDKYYGGDVAAPVFAEVMSGALRMLNVPPDQHTTAPEGVTRLAYHGGQQ